MRIHKPALLWLAVVAGVAVIQPALAAAAWSSLDAAEQSAAIAEFQAIAEQEREHSAAPSVAIAVAAGGEVVWSGAVRREQLGAPPDAAASSLYRAGAMTELLTSILVLRLADERRLDLDAPVAQYVPTFAPQGSFGGSITVRHLLSHRSGLMREPPRGNYYDSAPADLITTISSLEGAALEFRPGSQWRRSSAGMALAGRVAEMVTGDRYEDLVTSALLAPWGMQESVVRLTPAARARVAHGEIAPIDAEAFPAPLYEPGAAPALGLHSTIGDLGKFAAAALDDAYLRAALSELRRLQGTQSPAVEEGFIAGAIQGRRYWAFRARMPGHTLQLTVFDSLRLAMVTIVALDSAQGAVERLTTSVVERLTVRSRPIAAPAASVAVSGEAARRVEGVYARGSETVVIRRLEERTYLEGPDVSAELRRAGSTWLLDDARTDRRDVSFSADGSVLELGSRRYRRTRLPEPPAPQLASLLGDYGWAHYHVRVYERDGRLHARIGWNRYVQLQQVAPDAYAAAKSANDRKLLVFSRAASGETTAVTMDGVSFPRRRFGAEAQKMLREAVAADIPALRERALAASPPVEPQPTRSADLVAVTDLDPSIELDVRYASDKNFLGVKIYERPVALLQKPAAQALAAAHHRLSSLGYGLVVHDAYRPWYVTRIFWDAVPEHLRIFVADPSQGSRHNRGCAVDVSLYVRATGEIVSMPGEYDELSARSSPLYLGGTSAQRWRRDLLRETLEAEGFAVYPYEWWHFDYRDWRQYPVMNTELN